MRFTLGPVKYMKLITNTLNKFNSGDILVLQNEINKIDEVINKGYEIGMKIVVSYSLLIMVKNQKERETNRKIKYLLNLLFKCKNVVIRPNNACNFLYI